MCGISGAVGFTDPQVAQKAVDLMTTALQRRGPDSGGSQCWPDAVLGHRRLSIFDLSPAGNQPMLSDDRSIGVAFNGAVYNFKELRAELETLGHRFRSHTDTEVLVRGYAAWGIDALVTRLRGMFAFALWDEPRGRLFLVRDRLGVKPLLYAVLGESIVFASTARALQAAGFGGDLDDVGVAEFLEYGYVTDQRSIYAGVRKVPAASILEWSKGAVTARTYWEPPSAAPTLSGTFDDVVHETERLLLRAVERRLQADVPVGALLSGGIDSGLVCWAVKALGGDVTAFTVGTAGDSSDESDDASATARQLGLRHSLLQLAGTQPADVHDLIAAYAEPFACASALGMLRISSAVSRSNVKVLLTGDGGDDVFLGYERHRFLQVAQRIARRTPRGVAAAWRTMRRIVPMVGPVRRAAHFADYATGGMGAFLTARDGFPAMKAGRLLGDRLQRTTLAQRALPWSIESARHILDEYLEHDRRTQFVAEYMTKVDGSTMFYALEARSPFLDQELWEFASALPIDTRLRGGKLKAVLRELARRRIGERVAAGRKRGFTIPVERWMAGQWLPSVERAFADSVLAREGWIRADAVLRELRDGARRGKVPQHLWYLYVLEEWVRNERGDVAARTHSTRAA